MNRVRIQYNYEQNKFNLLREENEGFAKLIVELNQSNIDMSNVETVRKNIQDLIGFFNLDPNRVADLIIDAFENNVWNEEVYLALLKNFPQSYVTQLLGFKFKYYLDRIKERQDSPDSLFDDALIPRDLLMVTGILLREKNVKLEDIWSHLVIDEEKEDEIHTLCRLEEDLVNYSYKQLSEIVLDKQVHEASDQSKQKMKD